MVKLKALKTCVCLMLVLAALLMPVCAVDPPTITAAAAILYEVKSGEVLFEYNADVQRYPASTTKLMTAIVALENGNPSDTVTVSSDALEGLSERGSSIFLIAGEEMSFSDMLAYLLVASGNDAANALAEHVGGTIDNFVALMNEKAAELGCTNTHFANPHGLHDENHYTTARDLLLIARCAMENPTIAELVSKPQIELAATNKHPNTTTLTTTNHLLTKIRRSEYYYADAIGVKTGFTTPAGNCLVGAARNDDLTYITVVLGGTETEDGEITSFSETIDLFEYARDGFAVQQLVKDTDPITEVPVRLATDRDTLVLTPESSLSALLPVGFDPSEVSVDFTVDEDICAPIAQGQALGKATFTYNGKEYGTLSLVSSADVERSQTLYIVDRITSFFGSTAFRIVVGAVMALIILFVVWLFIMRARNKRRRRSRGRYRRR